MVPVKDNQETLSKQIEHGCKIHKPLSVFEEEWHKSHGRLEKRKYEVYSAFPTLNKWQEDWPYIWQMIKVTRYRQVLSSGEEMSEEIEYYASNGHNLKANQYNEIIRGHWSIENCLHYVKDKTVQEDILVKRENPHVFSCIIDCALNILRISQINNIRKSMYKNSLIFKRTTEKFREYFL